MSNLPTRPSSTALEPQKLGFLPTRTFWAGRKVAPVRATLAGLAAFVAAGAAATLAPAGLSLWAFALLCGLSTATAIVLTWGLIERLARGAR